MRFKKPQSAFLGRVLRDKVMQKQRRFDRMSAAGEAVVLGEREEEWEEIVGAQLGGKESGGEREREREGSGGRWKREEIWGAREKTERYKIMEAVIQDAKNSRRVGDKMLEIVDREKELRAKEDQERRLEKLRKKRERKKMEEDGVASF